MTTFETTYEQLSVLIGGELRPALSGAMLESINPATGGMVAAFPRCGPADVEDAVLAAEAAFPAWRDRRIEDRAEHLLALEALIGKHTEELSHLDVVDNGTPIRVMRNDAQAARDSLRYYAGLALQLRGETIPSATDRLNYTLRQPYGVVGKIIPFNHPLLFAVSRIASALLTGNTVVLKPSEHTSLSALRLGELSREVLPPGVLNIVTGLGDEVGDPLVVHPKVRRIAFIGSRDIGLRIQARAATMAVKTVTLELGGKNPLVVFPGADIDEAVDGAVRGMNFTWQGQSCGSTSRLMVHKSMHDDFLGRLVGRIEALQSGMPEDEATDLGAIVSRPQYEKVQYYIGLGRSEGADLVSGGVRPSDPALKSGNFIRPAVFDGVQPGTRLEQEEVFGPVLSVLTFEDYDEAIRIANGVAYGLTASVWTEDIGVAHRFARDVQAGYVWVNDSSSHFPGAAFGGFKDSGIGREEGIEELEAYTLSKNVNVRFR